MCEDDTSAMKDVVVSVDMSKDSDGDSSKPSSKTTSMQNSPAVQKGLHSFFLLEYHDTKSLFDRVMIFFSFGFSQKSS